MQVTYKCTYRQIKSINKQFYSEFYIIIFNSFLPKLSKNLTNNVSYEVRYKKVNT